VTMMSGESLSGLILNIERFASHDGPGIRTLVFMKGCPLRCLWCSTPQSQGSVPEILHLKNQCAACGKCQTICPEQAISIAGPGKKMTIDRSLCNACGACLDICPNDALELAGKRITVDALLQEVEKDEPFYRRSAGGVTVGGGEPTLQHRFVGAFLKRCRERYIHTALESCMYTDPGHLESILPHLDLLLCDIKHMNDESHRNLTGVSNRRILENIRLAASRCNTIIRIPTVPGCNDTEENIKATALFAKGLGGRVEAVELLPYHAFGRHLYEETDRTYRLPQVEVPTEQHMMHLKNVAESCGIRALVR